MAQGFLVDTGNCYGCKTCQISCANEKVLTPGVYLRRVRTIKNENPIGAAFVSMACNHCDEPACLAACPVGAYTKLDDSGLVVQNHDLCIGCQSCVNACPFHAPSYDADEGATYKCDGCVVRQEAGLDPVCVMTCPSSNIALGEMASMDDTGAEDIKDLVATAPNYLVIVDPDIKVDVFEDIDGAANFDRGGESY